MDLTKLSYEALHRYFTRLSQFGYMKYPNVELLLVLLYIQDISEYDFNTEELYILNKALSCLQGSNCMIPYSSCKGACD